MKSDNALALDVNAQTIPVSATLAMHELVAKKRAEGQEIIHMGFGQANFPLHPLLKNALAQSAELTHYAPTLGIPELREAIAEYLVRTRGIQCTAQQIAIGPGSKTLIFALLQILSGDVLLPTPSWVGYDPMARLVGKKIMLVPTDPFDYHRLTPDVLSQTLKEARRKGLDPKILLVNSPHNPTGSMFAEEDVKALAKWSREEEMTLISDEIYAELAHGWRKHVSPFAFYPEGCVITGGLSKSFSAGGWRLGYAVLPDTPAGKKAMTALRAVGSTLWSSASTPIQKAAVEAFKPNASIEHYVHRSAKLHGYIADQLYNTFTELGVPCPRPAGGFYLYPDFSPWRLSLQEHGVRTSDDLAKYLLKEWNIATLPSSEFNEDNYPFRLRLATGMLCEPGGTTTKEERDAALWKMLEQVETKNFSPSLPVLTRTQETWKTFILSLREKQTVASLAPHTIKSKTPDGEKQTGFNGLSVRRNLNRLRQHLSLIATKTNRGPESSHKG